MSVSQVLGSLGVPEGTASDGTVDTSINLHNVTQLKDLVDLGLSPEQRAQHAGALLERHYGACRPAGRLAAAPADRARCRERRAEPGGPRAARRGAPDHRSRDHPGDARRDRPDGDRRTDQTATSGTAQPPAGPPMQVSTVWDVSTPDGSLRVIDLPNGIELLDGGCIVARSTPLHFTCSSLTRTGAPPAGYSGDFNILGTTGAPVATPAQPPGRPQAPSGAPGTCVSASVAGEGGGNGAPGQQGTAGAAARGATTASPAHWPASPSPAA